jgi:predicted methyltransferase
MLRKLFIVASAAALIACATTEAPPRGGVEATAAYAASVSDANRPEADVAKDAVRKPAETLAFARLMPGQHVAEVLPGGGYFTRLLSRTVGPNGKVHAIVPASALSFPDQIEPVRAIAANAAYGNVYVETPDGPMTPSEPVDVYFTAQNYHDIHAYFGADAAAAFNKAVFESLKPGGTYIVIDHSAVAGAGVTGAKTVHRIEASVVKAEVVAAGFVFDGESTILANPADPRTATVFDASIRGRTDQFMLRFKKPG